jgi:hypothetical protein
MKPKENNERSDKADSARLVQRANLDRQYEEVCRLRKELDQLAKNTTKDTSDR